MYATNLVRLLYAFARKAVGEKIVPAIDNRKQYYTQAQDSRRELTVAMMKSYPQLLHKYIADKAKVSPLVEIMRLLKLELYSLKRQEQVMTFCSTDSQADLQDYAKNKLKDLENNLIIKLKVAIKEVQVKCFLLLNMYLYVAWCLLSIDLQSTEESISALISKRDSLFEQLECITRSLPNPPQEGRGENILSFRVIVIQAEMWCLFKKSKDSSTVLDNETEDEDANAEYIEDTNRDAIMLAAAKLVATRSVPMDYLAPKIISHFGMHGASITDIIKHLISVIRKTSNDEIPIIFLEALKRTYERHVVDDESLMRKSYSDCKALVSGLSTTFIGAARYKHKSEILNIVKDGIPYAFSDAPEHLSFLEVAVLPFVSKLPTLDILEILKDVQKRSENVNMDEDPSGWRPYSEFVKYLQKCAKNDLQGTNY
ncbi:hypothetical protein Cni_G19448 [Canna indica]|uniref:Cohesin subunit SCC3/SA HEAT-repeats domain-containing protein n=1 Tax=Canna indica TaxID=4628 RepID=A0AAQ3KL76_9LILI|nr:hypothetical protein Cni_G19448 [Canna indica]